MAAGVLGVLVGCDKPPSFGEDYQIAVVTSSEVWEALGQEIVAALEPRTFTVRDERIFEVAYVQPEDRAWSELRRMRQVLLIGSAREPFIADALAGQGWEEFTPPVVIQLPDVWAQNQLVTVALLPDAAEPRVLEPLLPKVGEVYLRQFEDRIRIRLAVVPPNDRLTERLREVGGFTLVLPRTYDHRQLGPGLFVFRHEETGLTPLIQTITVDSRPRDAVDWTAEGAAAWRAELAERLNQPPHLTERVPRSLQDPIAGRPAVQIQGVWSSPPGEWPSAGPFLSRIVQCGERVFLIDAWLYAPGDPKYEYMYALHTILDTFRCPAESRGLS